MNVNSDVLSALLTTYQTRFGAEYNRAMETQSWRNIVQVIPSETLNEKVPFSGAPPRVQDTTDGAVSFEDVGVYSIDVSNRVFQAGWEIQREAFNDDRYRLFQDKPAEMAQAAAEHPGEYLWGLIEANGNAYDGTAFYANTRVIGASANIDNLLGGTGTDPVDLAFDLNTAQIAMFNFQTDKGRPIKRMGNVITCSINLFQAWYEALGVRSVNDSGEQTRVTPGEPFFTAGRYTVIVNPEATDTDNWQLHSISGSIKPFLMTDRETPSLSGTGSTDTYEWSMLRKAQYVTYARYGRGYGDPRLSINVVN